MTPPSHMSQPDIDSLLRELLAGYVAVADAPSCYFLEELCRLYPDAVVICTTRDADSWWASYKVLVKTIKNPFRGVLRLVIPEEIPRFAIRWKVAVVRRWVVSPSPLISNSS